jgi:protein-arginine kinase activator protein McsA
MSIKILTKCDDCNKIEECNIHLVETLNGDNLKFYYCDKCNKERLDECEPYIDW